MKQRTKVLVESIGVASVVLSLLIVAYQIQQSNVIAQVTTEYEIANNYSEWNESQYEPETAKNLARIFQDPTDFVDREFEDQFVLYSYAARSFYIWLAAEKAYLTGMLSERTYEMALQDIPVALSAGPGMPSAYRVFLSTHPAISGSEIADIVSEIIGQ